MVTCLAPRSFKDVNGDRLKEIQHHHQPNPQKQLGIQDNRLVLNTPRSFKDVNGDRFEGYRSDRNVRYTPVCESFLDRDSQRI